MLGGFEYTKTTKTQKINQGYYHSFCYYRIVYWLESVFSDVALF